MAIFLQIQPTNNQSENSQVKILDVIIPHDNKFLNKTYQKRELVSPTDRQTLTLLTVMKGTKN